MRYKVIAIKPNGESFEIPMTVNDHKEYNAFRILRKYKERYGTGYRFLLEPLY